MISYMATNKALWISKIKFFILQSISVIPNQSLEILQGSGKIFEKNWLALKIYQYYCIKSYFSTIMFENLNEMNKNFQPLPYILRGGPIFHNL